MSADETIEPEKSNETKEKKVLHFDEMKKKTNKFTTEKWKSGKVEKRATNDSM